MAVFLLPVAGIRFFVGAETYGSSRGSNQMFFVQCALSASVADLRDAIAKSLRERPIPSQRTPPPACLDGAELVTGWDKDGGNVLGVFQRGALVPNDEAVRLSDVMEAWGRNVMQFCIRWPISSLRPAGDQPEEMVANWAQAFMGGDAGVALHADGSCSGWIRDPSTIADNSVNMIFKGLGTWAVTEDAVSFQWIIAEHGRDSDEPANPAIALEPMSEEALAQFENAALHSKTSMTWAGQLIKKFGWH